MRSVQAHQQQLMTIVEDWDYEDRMMFIGDYPNIHDGSLLYLVQLEGGSRMKVGRNNPYLISLRRGQWSTNIKLDNSMLMI